MSGGNNQHEGASWINPPKRLVDGLKQALNQPGEQRLFRSGKLPGIFPGRSATNADAAASALRDGLPEITRTETKGKVTTEWVRATPRAVEFVHQHESPVQALADLQAVLQMTQQGIPAWMAELRNRNAGPGRSAYGASPENRPSN